MIYAEYLADFNAYIVLEGIDKIMGCSWNSKDNPLDVYESAAIIVWPHNSVCHRLWIGRR